jgi:GntR family transcriptional regulator, transcriptional repressor for pyruvate dehydrogenase complex
MASDGTAALNERAVLPVSKLRPAYQQVADQLRELILTGSLTPGDRLPTEAELATNFGVSRSTVREALRVLASQGLIITLRGTTGGTFVARVQPDQVSQYLETSIGLMSGSEEVTVGEMLEARDLLEVPAARLAAERREPHHVDALRVALDREMQSRGRGGKFQEHRNFHTIITEAAGNKLLVMMTEPVFRVLQSRFLNPSVPEAFWPQVDHDHEQIIAAIESGDGEASAQLMHEHLRRIRTAYEPGP